MRLVRLNLNRSNSICGVCIYGICTVPLNGSSGFNCIILWMKNPSILKLLFQLRAARSLEPVWGSSGQRTGGHSGCPVYPHTYKPSTPCAIFRYQFSYIQVFGLRGTWRMPAQHITLIQQHGYKKVHSESVHLTNNGKWEHHTSAPWRSRFT